MLPAVTWCRCPARQDCVGQPDADRPFAVLTSPRCRPRRLAGNGGARARPGHRSEPHCREASATLSMTTLLSPVLRSHPETALRDQPARLPRMRLPTSIPGFGPPGRHPAAALEGRWTGWRCGLNRAGLSSASAAVSGRLAVGAGSCWRPGSRCPPGTAAAQRKLNAACVCDPVAADSGRGADDRCTPARVPPPFDAGQAGRVTAGDPQSLDRRADRARDVEHPPAAQRVRHHQMAARSGAAQFMGV